MNLVEGKLEINLIGDLHFILKQCKLVKQTTQKQHQIILYQYQLYPPNLQQINQCYTQTLPKASPLTVSYDSSILSRPKVYYQLTKIKRINNPGSPFKYRPYVCISRSNYTFMSISFITFSTLQFCYKVETSLKKLVYWSILICW